MTKATIETGKVYSALASVLKSLAVQKNGTLPGNMGGKSYITAVDASSAVKALFVENNLIFLPTEKVVNVERILNNNRLQVGVVVEGEYTIVHTEDGSSVTVGGTGDGLATGTAVASNIASTNALKNALLRTFLITEQSVEDQAKNGVEGDSKPASPAQRKIDAARKPEAKKPTARDLIRKEFLDTGEVDKDRVNAMVSEEKANSDNQAEAMQNVLERLRRGER